MSLSSPSFRFRDDKNPWSRQFLAPVPNSLWTPSILSSDRDRYIAPHLSSCGLDRQLSCAPSTPVRSRRFSRYFVVTSTFVALLLFLSKSICTSYESSPLTISYSR